MSKYLTVIIGADNKVYLPYNTSGRKPLYSPGKCNDIKLITFLTGTTIRYLSLDEIKLPFDFNYIVGHVPLDNIPIDQFTSVNFICRTNKVTITKLVTSWGQNGDILNGKKITMWLRDIDFNTIKREITINDLLL